MSNRNESGSLTALEIFKIGFKLSLSPRCLHFLHCALIIVMIVQLITGQGWINTGVLSPPILGFTLLQICVQILVLKTFCLGISLNPPAPAKGRKLKQPDNYG